MIMRLDSEKQWRNNYESNRINGWRLDFIWR